MDLTSSYVPEYEHYPLKAQQFKFIFSIEAPCASNMVDRAPVSISTVLDRSGSMTGDKIELLKNSVEYLIDILSDGDSLGIISYSSNSTVDIPLTGIDQNTKPLFHTALNNIVARGGTNLSAGLLDGLHQQSQVKDDQTTLKSIILFTDGLANHGITDLNKIRKQMQNYLDIEFPPVVHTIGYGTNHDYLYLQSISEAGNGMYYFISDQTNIASTVGFVIGGLLSVTTQNIVVTLIPEGSSKINSIRCGGNVTSSQMAWTVTYPDLYAEEKRDILIDMDIPPVKSSTNSQQQQHVMTINLVYHNPITEKDVEQTSKIYVIRKDEAYPNKVNQEVEIVQLRYQVIDDIEAAIELKANGDTKAATDVLDKTLMTLTTSPSFVTAQETQHFMENINAVKAEISIEGVLSAKKEKEIINGTASLTTQRAVSVNDMMISSIATSAQIASAEAATMYVSIDNC